MFGGLILASQRCLHMSITIVSKKVKNGESESILLQ